MPTLHSFQPISVDKLYACDLFEEALVVLEDGGSPQAFRAMVSKPDGTPEAQVLDVLYVPAVGRIGIAWGADSEWADTRTGETVEFMVEMFLSDHTTYEARA